MLGNDGKPAPDLRLFAFSTPEGSVLKLRLMNPDSAWGRAGLHTGDRLVSLDGHTVATMADFRQWIRQLRIGQAARLEVMRNGTVSTAAVVVTGYDRPIVRIQESADATLVQLRLRTQWANGEP
jgi:predicted metalloprotease with PDZ domain